MSENKDIKSGDRGFVVERVDQEGKVRRSVRMPPQQTQDSPTIVRRSTPSGERVKPQVQPKKTYFSAEPAKKQDFEVDFNFEEEYETPDERMARVRAVEPRREKRTGCLGGILYFLFVICISVAIAAVGWIWAMDVLGLGEKDEVVEVSLPRNVTIDEAANVLYDNGLVKYKYLFKLYTKFSSASEKIAGGTYQLNRDYDYRALVYGLTPTGKVKVEADPITIPEGYTVRQIFDLLDANEICFKEDLWDAAANYDFEYDFLDASTLGDANRLEGYLFPDTYNFYISDKPSRVINKMLSNFNKKLTDEYKARAEELGRPLSEIITIASLIEKEAAGDDERTAISSVIYNRLKSNVTMGLLQIDASIYYSIAGTDIPFSTDIDDPYNTYKYAGLTPGPIANPGIASIKAALYPDSTNYYYYALGTDGVHHFFNSYDSFTKFLNSSSYKKS